MNDLLKKTFLVTPTQNLLLRSQPLKTILIQGLLWLQEITHF